MVTKQGKQASRKAAARKYGFLEVPISLFDGYTSFQNISGLNYGIPHCRTVSSWMNNQVCWHFLPVVFLLPRSCPVVLKQYWWVS
ncbi:MAG: hypothetical protein Q8K59_03540 [Nitrosomonas sp.]|nr:hypothetical protein [Nitrosomonas sp.]MDP1950162.1 hypothetical protein [Nitrosomonas sp.]